MIQIIWDTRGYFFWMLVVSLVCLLLERARPWRRQQPLFRPQLAQDLFWLIFNGHYAGLLLAMVAAYLLGWVEPVRGRMAEVHLLSGQPLWVQFLIFFTVKDFLEWLIHNALHRIPWLWSVHKLHHSIEILDWIGNFRFHWLEIVIYRGLSYFPLVILGVDERVLLPIAVVSTLIGHLNHSNLNITWGPLRYILNSPRMHVWHHDFARPAGFPAGMNFGINLSLWDWIFGTAYWPDLSASPTQQPSKLGFEQMEQYPRSLMARILFPLSMLSRRRQAKPQPGDSPN